jgi:hypothetical protein
MGLFSTLFRTLGRPYIRVAQDLNKSARGIKSSLDQLKEMDISKSSGEVEYVQAEDGKKAFEVLYERGRWSAEQLQEQRRVVHRTKWVFLVCTAISVLMFFVLGLTSSNVFFTLLSTGSTALSSAIFGVRSLQYAIFEAQLDERHLWTFNEFMSRSDFWKRVFS